MTTSKNNYMTLSKKAKGLVSYNVESAINWEESKINSNLPVSADTMKCDARWFNVEKNEGTAETHASEIGGHINASLSKGDFGGGADIAHDSSRNQEEMASSSEVLSTLVITCMCTHKNATTISPCIFDTEKLLNAWNHAFPKNP